MEVFFYLPEKYLPDPARQEAWKSNSLTALEERGKIASAQAWIYQTWLALENSGCRVQLTHTIPSAGVLVTLSGCVGDDFRPGPKLFFADIVADFLPHPAAHLHLLQNPLHARRLAHSVFMPHWPHPNLLPRDPARGGRFETLGFFGDAANLAPELRDKTWQARLRENFGLDLVLAGADGWHDYRGTDCVLAVRSFGKSPQLHKPATKLYNAWLAGVPFIGGLDSAYRGNGDPGADYLAAGSLLELENHLRQLKMDVSFREGLVAAGRKKSASFNREAILRRWRQLAEETLPEAAADWNRKSSAARSVFSFAQAAHVWIDRRRRR